MCPRLALARAAAHQHLALARTTVHPTTSRHDRTAGASPAASGTRNRFCIRSSSCSTSRASDRSPEAKWGVPAGKKQAAMCPVG